MLFTYAIPILIIVAFLSGLYFCVKYSSPRSLEGLTNMSQPRCPNILVQKTKNENNDFIHNIDNSKLHIITFFKEFEDDEIMNSVQQKCIIENINNKDVKSICIV